MADKQRTLTRLGFSFRQSGTHSSRTMMLRELQELLAFVKSPAAEKADYQQAVNMENCLGKRSGKTRQITLRHLINLYGLDNSKLLFRALRFFWLRDVKAQPLLALLCTHARDAVFRFSVPFILQHPTGANVSRAALEEIIANRFAGRFSPASIKSVTRNICSTWTKSGHLQGHSIKIRTNTVPTVGSVSYALLLGYLNGLRGQMLFCSEYIRLLDCSPAQAVELAESAACKGWINLKRIDNVIEVLFPGLINEQEQEWLRESN
jgi:hypothetical protein